MSLVFAELIICLLPGFLGLWVFKRIVQEDIDKRGEFTQVAIALLLSMSAFFFLNTLYYALKNPWISPDALVFPEREKGKVRGLFSVEREFWTSYAALCLLSLFSGGLWAFIREKKWWPTKWLPRLISKCLGRGAKDACESTLRRIVDKMSEKEKGPGFVRVYSLGNKDAAVYGWWNGYSETEKEISVTLLELCDFAPDVDIEKIFIEQPRQCWINHNSGVVVEFWDCPKAKHESYEKYLLKKHDEAMLESCGDRVSYSKV